MWSLRRHFAAVLSGILIVLASAEYDIWLCAWFALVPLILSIEGAPHLREAFSLGYVSGFVVNLWGFSWIVGLMERFGPLSLPWAVVAHLAYCAYHALLLSLFAASMYQFRKQLGVRGINLPISLLAPVLMVACERLFPAVFPWNLGVTQAWVLPVVQVAEWVGPSGVTALLMLASGAVCDACLRGRKALPSLVVVGLLVAGSLLFGFVRLSDIERIESKARTLHVGVVQANLPHSEDLRDPFVARRRLTLLQHESQKLANNGTQLTVWSETAYPYLLPRSLGKDFGEGDPMRIQGGFSTPLIFGAPAVDLRARAKTYTNSAFFLDSLGHTQAPYAKNVLVPFGEKVPFETQFPSLRGLRLQAAGAFSEGTELVTFELASAQGPLRLAPMICLEDSLPDHALRVSQHQPDLLVSLSNDAWFGATREPMQHLALAIFRSVELRVPMVRAVHNGPSALVSASGRVLARTERAASDLEHRMPEHLEGKLALASLGPTPFARYGWVFPWLCAGLLLLGHSVCLQGRLARRRVGEGGR